MSHSRSGTSDDGFRLHLQITELVFFPFLSFVELCRAVEPSATLCKAFRERKLLRAGVGGARSFGV